MKSRAGVFMGTTLAILFLLGMFVVTTGTSEAKDKGRKLCEKACEEVYKTRRFECKRFSGRERKRCEKDAKSDRHNCKKHCR